jgi:hypothetical protein
MSIRSLRDIFRAVAVVSIAGAGLAHAAPCSGIKIAGLCYHLTTIALPGATGQIAGVNDFGTITGAYLITNTIGSPGLSFVQPRGGAVKSFADPNSPNVTQAEAINDLGTIVGYYSDQTTFSFHGFVLTGEESGSPVFTQVDLFPTTADITGTIVRGINNSGDLVGRTQNRPGGDTAFLRVGSTFTAFNYNNLPTNARGANDFREIVGDATVSTTPFITTGFHRSAGGQFTAIVFPGASSTGPSSINDLGIVGGTYLDKATPFPHAHGFVYNRLTNQYSSVDIPLPNVIGTNVIGVNNLLQIWGNYTVSGSPTNTVYGYVLTPAF